MYLCSDGHEEICHENRECPFCEMKNNLEKQLYNANEQIEDLKQQVEDYENAE